MVVVVAASGGLEVVASGGLDVVVGMVVVTAECVATAARFSFLTAPSRRRCRKKTTSTS